MRSCYQGRSDECDISLHGTSEQGCSIALVGKLVHKHEQVVGKHELVVHKHEQVVGKCELVVHKREPAAGRCELAVHRREPVAGKCEQAVHRRELVVGKCEQAVGKRELVRMRQALGKDRVGRMGYKQMGHRSFF